MTLQDEQIKTVSSKTHRQLNSRDVGSGCESIGEIGNEQVKELGETVVAMT